MRSPALWFVLLGLAALQDCAIALYHFVLPYQFSWRSALHGVPDSLVWTLFALNFSWSLLTLLAGLLVFYAAKLGPAAGPFVTRTVFTVGLFWAIHGAYTWMNPFPMPRSLMWVRYIIDAFPAVVVALHWSPLLLYRTYGVAQAADRELRSAS